MARQELFVTWLNDAHAMENVVATALKDQAALAENHPDVKSAIEQHLEATNRHMKTVEGCLESLGESPSGMKDTMAKMGGKMQSMMQAGSGDTLLKAALNDYSAEHMEIASYESLIVAANELGHIGSGLGEHRQSVGQRLQCRQGQADQLNESVFGLLLGIFG